MKYLRQLVVSGFIGLMLLAPQIGSAKLQLEFFNPTSLISTDSNQQSELFELTEQVMENKILYKFLNRVFANQLEISPEKQQSFGWPSRSKGLSSTQVMFLLQNLRGQWDLLKTYLKTVNEQNFSQPEVKLFRDNMRKQFAVIFKNEGLVEKFRNLNDPTEPLEIKTSDGEPGYEAMELYVNHKSLSDPLRRTSAVVPEQDLKALVIDFIKGSKKSLTYNIFEFNLMDIAKALKDQNALGVEVLGGIHFETINLSPANTAVYEYLKQNESETFKTVSVQSSGLNHQKIIIRDAGTPDAALLLLSGNFTQSCIGPEGDAAGLPATQRPKESIPNANHALIVKGSLPAMVARYELEKTLLKGFRGQSNYPISGSYIFYGPQMKPDEKPPFFLLSFSPNGGMGEVNRDIIRRVILSTQGPIWTMQFAFSSPEVIDAITTRAKAAREQNKLLDFRAVGDPPFALREWSAFVKLSGLKRDLTTKIYSSDLDSTISKILEPTDLRIWQSKIRVNPKMFGTYDRKQPDQSNIHLTVKLHHKVFIFPEDSMAIVGTSFNPSANAEGNQEQIAVVSDPRIVKKISGAFSYLFFNSPQSIIASAYKRNQYTKLNPVDLESESGTDSESSAIEKALSKP